MFKDLYDAKRRWLFSPVPPRGQDNSEASFWSGLSEISTMRFFRQCFCR